MGNDFSERRLIENELIFRELNQKVIDGLMELKDLAIAHDQASMAPDTTDELHFYCECSNLDCSKRILISPEAYRSIHENPRNFVIVKGHDMPDIEKVVESTSAYDVVEKNRVPSQVVGE